MEDIQAIKQRFEIIGSDLHLNRALEKAVQVAPTDISVLVTGESGVGKEAIPKIIHHLSHRKHARYIAVNCGAIPEGTIDSELFGHEKGAFTGATQTRSGYFEVADKGTIFLDEVGELPITTQVRLLRVLENGEFLKVGSSQVQKTDVRIVAATNMNMFDAIQKGRFREDLYYRLSTVEIHLPPLRERRADIHLLFRKFASDFGRKYNMPAIRLTDEAVEVLQKYHWPGNVRQLRNITEQISVLEKDRLVGPGELTDYLPERTSTLPAPMPSREQNGSGFKDEREIMFKILFDMKSDLNDLKKLTLELLNSGDKEKVQAENEKLIRKIYGDREDEEVQAEDAIVTEEFLRLPPKSDAVVKAEAEVTLDAGETRTPIRGDRYHFAEEIQEEETLSLQEKEVELIRKSLERNRGKRKAAAAELGISERTLYRKIKQYDL